MPGIYDTAVLTGTVNSLQIAPSFLTGTFFPRVVAEESAEIHFDVEKDVMKLAPFVSPLVEGRFASEKGFTTKTFKPAYIKQKTALDMAGAIKRVFGEGLTGTLSPMERQMIRSTNTLMDHRTMILRRLEWMASSALRTGQVVVSGEQYPALTLDFGRDSALTITLGSGSKWTDTGIKPLANLQTWSSLILSKSGSPTYNVVMDIGAWNVFKEDSTVNTRLQVQRALAQPPTLKQDAINMLGAVYMGTVDSFPIWVYNQNWADDTGTINPMLPNGTVLMVGDLMGVQQYGAIYDEAAGLAAVPIFSKSWIEDDPSTRIVMSQSAPLLVPYRINATLCASVL